MPSFGLGIIISSVTVGTANYLYNYSCCHFPVLYSWKQGPALPECEPFRYVPSEAFCGCHHPVTFQQLQNHRMSWSGKDHNDH